jgi:hypothetical protein
MPDLLLAVFVGTSLADRAGLVNPSTAFPAIATNAGYAGHKDTLQEKSAALGTTDTRRQRAPGALSTHFPKQKLHDLGDGDIIDVITVFHEQFLERQALAANGLFERNSKLNQVY